MYGLLYAIGIFACSLAQALGTHHNWGLGIRVGTHTRMVLMAAVMKKMLRLSPEARLSYSIGEMSNIVSVDAARIADSNLVAFFHWFGYSAFIVMCISIYALFQLISWSVFIGVVSRTV